MLGMQEMVDLTVRTEVEFLISGPVDAVSSIAS